jgi:hypothetical protein
MCLLCRFTGKDVERNLRRPLSITELDECAVEWDKRVDKTTGKQYTRPRNQVSVLNNVTEFIDMKDTVPAAPKAPSANMSVLSTVTDEDRAQALAVFQANRKKTG